MNPISAWALSNFSKATAYNFVPYHADYSTHIHPIQRPFYSDGAGTIHDAGTILQGKIAFGVTNFHNILILDHLYLDIYHSTETVMVKVQGDILHAIDSNRAVVLLMLDLSAAFDTVSHTILLNRLSQRYGITGSVQEWFASYLSSRSQFVQIECSRSSPHELNCGVPQGSVLGPLLYVLYTSPVADIIKSHNLMYHLYADDTQLYVPFKLGSDHLLSSAKSNMEICVQEINDWMIFNGLKLNEDKTERLLLSPRYRPCFSLEFVRVGDETVHPSSSVRNLGVIFNPSDGMEDHTKKICKSCHFHLTYIVYIGKIRSYLDRESTEAIFHAFVTTNLDYCNAILYGLPMVFLKRLQLVQNRAVRIITFTKKYEDITPSLIDLHWLPVEYRIRYNILLLVYKAINAFSPSYISNYLCFCSSSYSLLSCSNKLLHVPRSKLKCYGDRRFSIAAPKLWNSIPAFLRNANSLNSFKNQLKTYLFHQAFPKL